jgi:predicted alpha-1,2-mannosidase
VPDAWIAGYPAFRQGGCSAAVLAGEAALKNLPGIDFARALRILRRDAEQHSPDPYFFGRYLESYRDLGYVSIKTPQCVSRHLEYTYQDWCLARLAEAAGDALAAQSFDQGARKLWNLWRQDLRSFAPRRTDGEWFEPFDPNLARLDSWNDPWFYEGTGRQWSWNAQHDFAGLVTRFGGPDGFIAALDEFFQAPEAEAGAGFGASVRLNRHGSKETMLHVPYLYHYAGRPDRTAEMVRGAMQKYFKPTRDGLHDNEDMGCQSAFYLASALGIYPLYGQDLYWLTTPVFTRSEITFGAGGNRLVIEAPNACPELPYIASARLNGKALDRPWLRHGEIAAGALIQLDLAAKPTAWGINQPPPSPGRQGRLTDFSS